MHVVDRDAPAFEEERHDDLQRVRLADGGEIRQITEDDSLVARQVGAGLLSAEEASRSPLRGHLTQAVGAAEAVDIHISTVPLESGAVFIVCSDGLSEVVNIDAIGGVAHIQPAPGELCETLVDMALEAETKDNVTVAAARIAGESPPAAVGAPNDDVEMEAAPMTPAPSVGSRPPETAPRASRSAADRRLLDQLTALAAVALVFMMIGLFVGKQVGVFGMVALARLFRLAKLPEDTTWGQVYGVALLCGVGFTMSLFIGTLAFEHGNFDMLYGVKMGVLAGSLLSAAAGLLVLHLALPKKAVPDS